MNTHSSNPVARFEAAEEQVLAGVTTRILSLNFITHEIIPDYFGNKWFFYSNVNTFAELELQTFDISDMKGRSKNVEEYFAKYFNGRK